MVLHCSSPLVTFLLPVGTLLCYWLISVFHPIADKGQSRGFHSTNGGVCPEKGTPGQIKDALLSLVITVAT